jgi:membrane associated rhomboid family serine protease
MPFIPIGTDVRPRHPPIANWALIGVNVLVFLFTDYLGGQFGQQMKSFYALDGARPSLPQYVTYQFLHGDAWHLLGNMLFLWIFGNAVCDRMGGLAYICFYLAGGVFAGVAFTWTAQNPLVGASGAIAAVTTAFLALYPRVHVTMLFWMFFIFPFQIPAMILIVFKMIVWDNVLAPALEGQGTAVNVAYSAHLGGYAFGFVIALALLMLRVLPRSSFDLPALWDRWRRRTGLRPALAGGPLLARPIHVEELDSRPLDTVPLTPIERLREEIGAQLADRDVAAASETYLRLLELDDHQVLARPQQLEVANHLAQTERYRAAAHAYESFLIAYPGSADAGQVLLFLGLIYSRYLGDFPRAVAHLQKALTMLRDEPQRALAAQELQHAEGKVGGQGS